MPKLNLTAEQIHELWDVDIDEGTIKHKFNRGSVSIGDDATNLMQNGYLRVAKRINGENYHGYAHQIIGVAAGNEWPTKYEVLHHKDEDKTNNRIDNLICLSSSNHPWTHSNKPEDLRYIDWMASKQIWKIRMTINHKEEYFGCYKDIEDAKTARDEILKLLAAEDNQ